MDIIMAKIVAKLKPFLAFRGMTAISELDTEALNTFIKTHQVTIHTKSDADASSFETEE